MVRPVRVLPLDHQLVAKSALQFCNARAGARGGRVQLRRRPGGGDARAAGQARHPARLKSGTSIGNVVQAPTCCTVLSMDLAMPRLKLPLLLHPVPRLAGELDSAHACRC